MKYILLAVSIALLIFLVIDFNGRTAELSRLQADRETILDRYNRKLQTKSALEAQIAFATSDAAVIQWAYENHMVKPGDIPVVPVVISQVTPTPTLRPIVTQSTIPSLERWKWLFFDQPGSSQVVASP